MAIVGKSNGAILAPNGIIADGAGDPCKCCQPCPDCRIPRTGSEICECIPTRFKIDVAGATVTCSCYCADSGCPTPPNLHFECSGSLTTYCCTDNCGPDDPVQGGWIASLWGNDGPPDCGAPTTLVDFGVGIRVILIATFGAAVDITLTIFGVMDSGTNVTLFYGNYNGADCEGPWILSNEAGGACIYDPTPTFPNGNFQVLGGGVAVVTACDC